MTTVDEAYKILRKLSKEGYGNVPLIFKSISKNYSMPVHFSDEVILIESENSDEGFIGQQGPGFEYLALYLGE
jgi:hypothetical protein